MKRINVSICIILAVVCCYATALADSGEYSIVAKDSIGTIWDICEDSGSWYLLSNLGIYRWSSNNEVPELIVDLSLSQRTGISSDAPTNAVERQLWEKGIQYIFLLDGQLMGIHPYTGQIFALQDGDMVPLKLLPEEQFFYDDYDELQPKDIVGCVVCDNVLYLALESFTYQNGVLTELYAWTPNDAQMVLMDAPDLSRIYSGADGCLLVKLKKDFSVQLYNIQDQIYERILWIENGENCSGYVWNPETDELFLVTFSGELQVADPDDGHAQTRGYLPDSFITVDRAYLSSDNMYYIVEKGNLFVRSMDGEGEVEKVSLRIVGLLDSGIMTGYATSHPNINISSEYNATDFLSIQQSIISGDTNIDIFIINSNISYSAVREKSYVSSLGTSTVLMERYNQFFPAIKDILVRDGDLVAYPASIMIDNWTVNATQWQSIGLGDYPTTVDDLFDLLLLWESDYADEYPNYALLQTAFGFKGMVSFVIQQYILENEIEGQAVDFNSEQLRQTLTWLLEHRELFTRNTDDCIQLIMPYSQYYGSGYNDSDKVVSIMPPSISHESSGKVTATLELFILNPRSNHKQEAIDFLEYYAEHMKTTFQYSLSSTGNVPIRPDGYTSAQDATLAKIDFLSMSLETLDEVERRETEEIIEEERSNYMRREQEYWEISQESIDIQQVICQNLKIPLQSVYTNDAARSQDEVIDQVIALFADGRLNVDQFLQMLNEKAMMILFEGL